jgi:hypothetical protein
MHKLVASSIGCFAAVSLSLVAQESAKPASEHQAATNKTMSSDATIKLALSAGPADLTKNAAVVEPAADSKMTQVRAGTN